MGFAGALVDRGLLLIEENWLFLAILLAALLASRLKGWRAERPKTGAFSFLLSGRRAVLLVVAVSLTAALTKAARDGVSLPQYHDDYAYLLAADTFARGHLSYPTHPFAEHFSNLGARLIRQINDHGTGAVLDQHLNCCASQPRRAARNQAHSSPNLHVRSPSKVYPYA